MILLKLYTLSFKIPWLRKSKTIVFFSYIKNEYEMTKLTKELWTNKLSPTASSRNTRAIITLTKKKKRAIITIVVNQCA